MKKFHVFILLTWIGGQLLSGCSDYLDVKPDQTIVVPQTLQDLGALLDNAEIMNENTPNLGEVSAGDSYVAPGAWQYLDNEDKAVYSWQRDLTLQLPLYLESWSEPYQQVLYANIALEGLDKISPDKSEQIRWNRIKGSALFYRSRAFIQLMGVFCETYEPSNADKQMGIPLRLSSAVEQSLSRATLEACYEQVTRDLQAAIRYLPRESKIKTRPGRAAAYALLAKAYLLTQDYPAALKYADSCLAQQAELIDYNKIDTGSAYSFSQFNEEVIFHATMKRHFVLPHGWGYTYVDSSLYRSYSEDDLRKYLFFDINNEGLISYKGSYDGSRDLFAGLATDEIYLIKAECLAHSEQSEAAVSILNRLLEKRYSQEAFVPIQAGTSGELLEVILDHRRKELVFRGISWLDFKRLHSAGLFGDTLKRVAEGKTFLLPPGDKRYVLPIPQMVIERSGIPQNDR